MPLICKINSIDYGVFGQNALTKLVMQPGELGEVGTITVTLLLNSSPTIKDKARLEVYEASSAGGTSTFEWCGGFLAHRKSRKIKGTTRREWTLTFQDFNLAFDRVVNYSAINVASARFDLQVVAIVSAMQGTSPAPALPIITSGITDIVSAAWAAAGNTPPVGFGSFTIPGGSTLREALAIVVDNAKYICPVKFYMSYSYASARVNPVLSCYDGNNPPASIATFSDLPTGGEIGPLDFEYETDGIDKVEKRQCYWNVSGGVVTSTIAANTTLTERNPLVSDGYWGGKANRTTYTTSGQAQSAIDAAVTETKENIETMTLKTNTRIRPGKFVTVRWTVEGINASYRVAAVSISFSSGGKVEYYQLTLNQNIQKFYTVLGGRK